MKPTNFLAQTQAAGVVPAPAASSGLRPAQIDGSQTTAPPAPVKGAGLQTRSASPSNYNTSGMERGMGALADKMHPVKRR